MKERRGRRASEREKTELAKERKGGKKALKRKKGEFVKDRK